MSTVQGIIFATLGIAWLLLIVWLGIKAMDEERWFSRWSIAAFTATVLAVGFIIGQAIEEERSGPCLREEQRLVWTGKVAVPMTVCVERGKWVDQ